VVGRLFGRPWLQAEIFGIAPDPTVVATLGVLMTADRTHRELLLRSAALVRDQRCNVVGHAIAGRLAGRPLRSWPSF
jgi:hypothetical protein